MMAELIFENILEPANVLCNAIIICTKLPDKHKTQHTHTYM